MKTKKLILYIFTIVWLLSLTIGGIISTRNKKDEVPNNHATFTEFSKGENSIMANVRHVFYLHLYVEDVFRGPSGKIYIDEERGSSHSQFLLWAIRVIIFCTSLFALISLEFFPFDKFPSVKNKIFMWGCILLAILLTAWRIDFYIYYITNWGLSTYI